jgi:hypothetical protein
VRLAFRRSAFGVWRLAFEKVVGTRSSAIRRCPSNKPGPQIHINWTNKSVIESASIGDPTFNDAPRRIAQERVPTSCNALGPVWTCPMTCPLFWLAQPPATSHQPPATSLPSASHRISAPQSPALVPAKDILHWLHRTPGPESGNQNRLSQRLRQSG